MGGLRGRSQTLRGARSRASGQTLIEVLVAMIVLGVGLVSVIQAFSVCSLRVSIARSETVARAAAMRMMAELRANPTLLRSDEEGDLGPEHPTYKWKRELRESPENGVMAVRITVAWTTRGVPRRYSLETLVALPRA